MATRKKSEMIIMDDDETNGQLASFSYESRLISIKDITAKIQPRHLIEAGVKRLVASMKQSGFLAQYPISVSLINNDETAEDQSNEEYRLFCGNHRLEAALRSGIPEVPALIYTDIPIDEQWRLANVSNQAHDAISKPTFVDDAEQVWKHLAEGLTQAQAATRMPGWSRAQVNNYNALKNFTTEVWSLISDTTFNGSVSDTHGEDVSELTQPVSMIFTEGLLRPATSLHGDQQLDVIKTYIKDRDKAKFSRKVELYRGRNVMQEEAEKILEDLPEEFLARALEEINKSNYDREYAEGKTPGPKFRQMLDMLRAEFYQTQNYNVELLDIREVNAENIKRMLKVEENECVDFILTDPPYGREYIDLFDTLGAIAGQVLKPGGSLLVMPGSNDVLEKMNMVAKHLKLYHIICYDLPGGQATQLWTKEMMVFWKPVFWFVKEPYEGFKWVSDQSKRTISDKARSAPNDNDKRIHKWGQSVSGMYDLIERYTRMGDVIYDPFVGAGPTGVAAVFNQRKFLGSDIDPKCVKVSLARLRAASLGQDPPSEDAK